MDESIRRQLEKLQTWFCKYFPKRIQNVGEKEIADRQLVYDFKDGRSHVEVAQMTAARMIEEHGSGCSQLVFILVPALSVRKNEIRPLATILGTLSATLLVSLILPHRSAAECMAVGSGFGYYSLSSIFITEYKGAEFGTIALLFNISREIITLLSAPLLVRCFGNLAPISAGGATTLYTTLPIITQYSGQQFVVVSIFHGFVTDFSVPFLVIFFCSI